MSKCEIPFLSQTDIIEGLHQALVSPRRRHPRLLHKPGDEFNQVFNFILYDSYMQPHLHLGSEKIENIYLIQGKLALLYFDESGRIWQKTVLEEGGLSHIEVPAFMWHTYVMLTERVITYETMTGRYEPATWKAFASWAPVEGGLNADIYLKALRGEVLLSLPR